MAGWALARAGKRGLTRAFITGGGGFVANHLARDLLRDGHEVFVLSRRRNAAGAPDGVRVVNGDLLLSKKPLLPNGTEVVFHLAAKSIVPESVADPPATFEVNALGTARLLSEVRTRGIALRRFVLASTGQVYGPPFTGRLREDHAIRPRNPYSASKAAAESFALACDALYDIPTCALRLFNIYGPGQRDSYVVPSVLRQCLWSDELKIGNPWPVRDFLFVDDAVRLFRLASSRAAARGEIINAGSGQGTRIEAMVRLAVKVTGASLKAHSVKGRTRPNDFDRLVADVGKARRLTGWRPSVSLADGLAQTAAAMRAQKRK